MKASRSLACAVLALAAVGAGAQTRRQGPLSSLKTRAERSEFRETSRYDDVVAFMDAVSKASPAIHLTTFGYTSEGRALPLAVVGAPGASADAVRRTGKTRVYIQGNIHAGEVEGKESAQILLRELAEGKHAEWLKSMVLLVAPIYNADGNERISLRNRGPQHGPVGGMGQRPNAQGFDLNRDHMKLDSPEARSFAMFMTDYDPHVAMDLHTTNGTRHAYHVTYAPPLNPATDPAIVNLLRKEWLPSVTTTIKRKYGWDYYYYGNVGGPGRGGNSAERRWATFDHRPRFNNNYIGLRNRIAILSEAYSYATFEDRIKATSRFVEENLNYAHAHGPAIRRLTEDADKRAVVGTELPLGAEMERAPELVEILMGDVVEEANPYTGERILRRADVRKPEKMAEYGTFKGLNPERVPSAYFVPPNLRGAIDRLRTHGIAMTPLAAASTMQVEEFRIESNQVSPREFEKHKERTLGGSWTSAERQLPAGTLRIDLSQPLARLAFYLIEPRSDDGLVNWNVLDDAIADAKVYPIVRTRKADAGAATPGRLPAK